MPTGRNSGNESVGTCMEKEGWRTIFLCVHVTYCFCCTYCFCEVEMFLLTATIPYDLFCPNVYEMIGAGSCENCVIYFLSKKAVDRHKKIYALWGILISQSLYLDEVKIRISVFKIQLSTECQSSRTLLNSQFVTMDFFVYAYIKQERGYAPTCTDVYSQGRRVKIFNFLGYGINKWALNICLCKFAGNELLVRFYKKSVKNCYYRVGSFFCITK